MKLEYSYKVGDNIKTVAVEPAGDCYQLMIDGKIYSVTVKQLGTGQLRLDIDGRQLKAHIASAGSKRFVNVAGQSWILERSRGQLRRGSPGSSAHSGPSRLEATMPGQVTDVLVSDGDRVERGQTLVLLEAMKMELRVVAPFSGQVTSVHCTIGQIVERGYRLVDVESLEEP